VVDHIEAILFDFVVWKMVLPLTVAVVSPAVLVDVVRDEGRRRCAVGTIGGLAERRVYYVPILCCARMPLFRVHRQT
jgi:hypothetical protein